MATKKYLSLQRLTEYDTLLKSEITDGDSSSLSSAKSYTDTEIKKITNGTTTISKATHAETADTSTSATKLGSATIGSSSQPIYLNSGTATKVSAVGTAYGGTGATTIAEARTNLDVYSKSEIDTALSSKASSTHNHDTAYDTKGAADTALASAKTYADSAATKVKNDLLNGAGEAYDTLKELGDLIDVNADAIDALKTVAVGKADKTHIHAISDVTGLQTALDGKASTSHTHNLSTMINTLSEGTDVPTDNDYYVSQYAGGGTTTTTYHRRHVSALWSYIKGKTDILYQAKGNYDAAGAANTALASAKEYTDTVASGKANTSHTHDDRYYTESEINTKVSALQTSIDGKASSSHTHNNATTSTAGYMSSSDKSKLDGITEGADAVSFSRSLTSGTKVGTITINGTGTDLYAPTNTDTHYASGTIVNSTASATTNATSALTNGNVYLNHIENGAVKNSHKISGSGATKVTTDASGNIIITSTDNNTTYGVATSSTLGLVKSGTDITVDSSGNVSVNDNSHSHAIANVTNLQSTLDGKVPTSRTVNGKELSANITLSASDVSAYTKTEIDAMSFITVDDIDKICGLA